MNPQHTSRSPQALVDHFFRHAYGQLLAALVRRFGAAHLQLAEDAVQAALLAALHTWASHDEIPENPTAWLQRVAHNHLLDQLRNQRRRDALNERWLPPADPSATEIPETTLTSEVNDDLLRMLFACCDPQLSARMQLVLALKLLCGFSVREIAQRLFISPANVEKTLTRGRSRLKAAWGQACAQPLQAAGEQLKPRLQSVRYVIYLLFNEGYSSQRDDQPIATDLCLEGLRLATLLASHLVSADSETYALCALLCFHSARLKARLHGPGPVVTLAQQDRSLWDYQLIAQGMDYLLRSGRDGRFTRFHAEAGVMAIHCSAPNYSATRWSEIVDLYEMLEQREPSPLHSLNRIIAIAEWRGPKAGLEALAAFTPPPWLADYYLWAATRGELLRRDSQFELALPLLQQAQKRAPNRAEGQLLQTRVEHCLNRDPTPF